MRDFRGLDVWQPAHRITLSVYRLTLTFPHQETYGIVSQMRRCSFSVAANLAEGCGRSGNPEFGRFLSMAMGSASELEYFLLLAHDLKYLPVESYQSIFAEIGQLRRKLNCLIARVRATQERTALK